jgi:uncharacterized membrane protein
MPASSVEKRQSKARRAKPATPKQGAKAAKEGAKVAKKGAQSVVRAAQEATPSRSKAPTPKRLARKAAKKGLKMVARKTAEMGAEAVRRAADRAVEAGRSAVDASASHLLPIQLSIDVAVPIHVAWVQWRSWGSLPEGVHRIEDVERDGDSLQGRTAGPRSVDWEAEIQDEREDESFAWRSVSGTDVAGLATLHRISDRLTRIELDLDVVPTSPSEAVTLALHLAHRHAEADLRRFKAYVEFISPDVYENGNGQNGKPASNGGRSKRSARNR